MYWLCMIATIPLATGNKLNCFISARGMLAIVWHCVLFFLCVCFFVDFLYVNKSSSQKKILTEYLIKDIITPRVVPVLVVLRKAPQRSDKDHWLLN